MAANKAFTRRARAFLENNNHSINFQTFILTKTQELTVNQFENSRT